MKMPQTRAVPTIGGMGSSKGSCLLDALSFFSCAAFLFSQAFKALAPFCAAAARALEQAGAACSLDNGHQALAVEDRWPRRRVVVQCLVLLRGVIGQRAWHRNAAQDGVHLWGGRVAHRRLPRERNTEACLHRCVLTSLLVEALVVQMRVRVAGFLIPLLPGLAAISFRVSARQVEGRVAAGRWGLNAALAMLRKLAFIPLLPRLLL